MSEIEKMYENAKVVKIGIRKCTTCEYLDCQNYCFISESNKCDKFSYDYPPFTAEKQIELIKWLSDTDYFIHNIYKTIDTKEYFIDNYYYDMQTDEFEETLAGLINKLWQDLTEEEKQQVKGILE